MYRKWAFIMVLLLSWSIVSTNVQAAQWNLEDYQADDVHILYIYTENDQNKEIFTEKIELLLYHFTDNINMKEDDAVTEEDFNLATEVVYYGGSEKDVDPQIVKEIDQFKGNVIVMGHNMEQFDAYSNFNNQGMVTVHAFQVAGEKAQTALNKPTKFYHIEMDPSADVLLYGRKHEEKYPIMMRDGDRYYLATERMEEDLKFYLADMLHDIIPNDHEERHLAYFRLEDIHPQSDPEKLLAVGEKLNERDIPYLLVVIPVYINPDTGHRQYLEDAPELVKVLQYLQSTNGTIIAHGYTHQYRTSETGEGFEFWDVENNQFIIEEDPTEEIEEIQERDDFANEQAYKEYITPLLKKEEAYIRDRVESAINELVDNDLYPLGFEPPHYTMSEQGYDIVGQYYSSIFGQIQFSTNDWEQMGNSPYVSTTSHMNGMTFYPETIGFFDELEPNSMQNMRSELEQVIQVRDSVIGGFFHPYLDASYIDEMIDVYETVPNIEWLDLKATNQYVATENIQIMSNEQGEISIEDNRTWWNKWVDSRHESFLEKALWVVTFIVGLFVLMFLLFTIRLRLQLKKRLFEERKHHG